MNSRKNVIISLVSGIFTAFSFIYDKAYLLVFISLAPTFYMIISDKSASFRYMFFHLYSFYFFADLWFFSVGRNFLMDKLSGFLLSFGITLVVSLILSLSASLPFLLLKRMKTQNHIIISVVIAFFYIFGEWVHSLPPINFPWNRLCNIVAVNTDLIQSCSLFGGLFISLIMVLINISVANLFYFIISKKILSAVLSVVSAVCIMLTNILLGYTADKIYSQPNAESNKILLVQPNYSVQDKRTLSAEQMLEGMLSATKENIAPNTRLVIFPETSVSERFFSDRNYNNIICSFSENNNISILFGTSHIKNNKRYNACTMISPDKKDYNIYKKRILVPFGEYTPFFMPENIQLLKKPFCKSDTVTLINSNIGKIGCTICFESIFPALSCENSMLGAELFVILTNDSWIGNSVPLYQHHSHSVIRAVENRKYTVTCANTGISSVITSEGRLLSHSQKNIKDTVTENVCTNNIRTLYSRCGDIIIIPAIAMILYFIAINTIYFLKNLAKF